LIWVEKRVNNTIQFDGAGRLRHFLTIDGLSRELLVRIMDVAESFSSVTEQHVKKVPLLRGKTIVNLFFENSTPHPYNLRAGGQAFVGRRAHVNIATSSASKGESLLDTIRNIEAMHVDMFVVRHGASGAAHFIARHVAPHISVINGEMEATPIRLRPCWICSPFARLRAIFQV